MSRNVRVGYGIQQIYNGSHQFFFTGCYVENVPSSEIEISAQSSIIGWYILQWGRNMPCKSYKTGLMTDSPEKLKTTGGNEIALNL